jgi:hypothetical protein
MVGQLDRKAALQHAFDQLREKPPSPVSRNSPASAEAINRSKTHHQPTRQRPLEPAQRPASTSQPQTPTPPHHRQTIRTFGAPFTRSDNHHFRLLRTSGTQTI